MRKQTRKLFGAVVLLVFVLMVCLVVAGCPKKPASGGPEGMPGKAGMGPMGNGKMPMGGPGKMGPGGAPGGAPGGMAPAPGGTAPAPAPMKGAPEKGMPAPGKTAPAPAPAPAPTK